MHLQIDWILNILMVQAKNDEERSAICMAKGNMTLRMEPELKAQAAALFKFPWNGFEYGNWYFLFVRHLGAMASPLR